MTTSRWIGARERLVSGLARQWREWRGYLLFFCCVWVPLRSAVVDYNPVPTGSMNPTIVEGDVVWVNKLAYGLRVPLTQLYVARWDEPRRGDIVVVLSPQDGTRLVKRVVGIPGDTVAMVENRLHLNGQPVTYASPKHEYGARITGPLRSRAHFAEEDLGGVEHPVMGLAGVSSPYRSFAPVVVPPGRYFLMGDSRDNSLDSRAFGLAARDDVLGRAGGVLVSFDLHDHYLPRPERFFTRLR